MTMQPNNRKYAAYQDQSLNTGFLLFEWPKNNGYVNIKRFNVFAIYSLLNIFSMKLH